MKNTEFLDATCSSWLSDRSVDLADNTLVQMCCVDWRSWKAVNPTDPAGSGRWWLRGVTVPARLARLCGVPGHWKRCLIRRTNLFAELG